MFGRSFFALLLWSALAPASASAQTVAQVAASSGCTTAGVVGLSRQLAETQRCLRPGAFVRFDDHPSISLTSSRVHPYAQDSARAALHSAASGGPLRVNSAFRTLADQYVLYHSGACGLAARPGTSNHQSGRAVDLANWDSARSRMTAAGCSWLGSRDPVHYDCPGRDLRTDAVFAFQRLWNLNHPERPLVEDGAYGPATAAALGDSPAGGFATGGCGAPPPVCEAEAETCDGHDDDCDGAIDEGACVQVCTSEPRPELSSERFEDLGPGELGYEEAALLADAGVTTGCSASPPLFCPRCPLTRAQMATFLVRALGVDVSPYASRDSFDDVEPGSTHHASIEAIRELGITTGCAPGLFCPGDPVTRAQIATFLVRARGFPTLDEPTGVFEDVPAEHTHRESIEALYEVCVTNGCAVGRYCPGAEVTRAQAAVLLARAFDLGGSNECLHETCNEADDDLDGAIDEGVLNACGGCGAVPEEVCSGLDDDCDGQVDEGLDCAPCNGGASRNSCGECGPPRVEVCDGDDDDCDARVDEDCEEPTDLGDAGPAPGGSSDASLPDAGAGRPGSAEGGCGCRLAGKSPSRPLGWLLVALALLGLRARRARRA